MTGAQPRSDPEDPDVQEAGAPRWLLALERAQALAHRAVRVLEAAPPSRADLGPAARAVEGALRAIFDAFDLRAERLAATRAARAELDRAAAAVEGLPEEADVAGAAAPLREACAALAVVEERCSRVPPETAPPPPELRASLDTPALHGFTRPSLVPKLRVPAPVPALPPPAFPPIPKPETAAALTAAIEELARRAEARRKALGVKLADEAAQPALPAAPDAEDDEPPEGFSRGRFKALSAGELVAARARDCFEEIALAAVQRAPLLGEPWRGARVVERRLLAAVDALAALGAHAIERLVPLVLDAPAKDPSRAFGIGVALGCIDGRDALAAAERVFRHLGPGVPEIREAFAGALKLVPHPALPLALRGLLSDGDAACRALAVEVLVYRGLATEAELVRAARDPEPRVAAAALPALGLARSTELDGAVRRALDVEDDDLREAAWLAMVLGDHPRATAVLSAELAGPRAGRAAVLLAIAGDDRDAAVLIERLRAEPTPALASAVGWAGAPEGVPALLDLLEHNDPGVQVAAAYALDRITGAQLHEEVEVEPEAIDVEVPAVEEPAVDEPARRRLPLARKVSERRDGPAQGSKDKVVRPTLDAALWRAHWAERLPEIRPFARYRRGHLYTPAVSLWELDACFLAPGERRMLQLELILRTGSFVRFDPHDWVSAQEDALRAWEIVIRRAGAEPGSFHRRMPR